MSEWCDFWGKRLNPSRTETIIVSGSHTIHLQSPPLTVGGTLLKESDDLDILGLTVDYKMSWRRVFARFPEQLLKDLVP